MGAVRLDSLAIALATEWLESDPARRQLLRGVVDAARLSWGDADAPLGWIGGHVADALEAGHGGFVALYDVLDSAVRLGEEGFAVARGEVTDALGAWAMNA